MKSILHWMTMFLLLFVVIACGEAPDAPDEAEPSEPIVLEEEEAEETAVSPPTPAVAEAESEPTQPAEPEPTEPPQEEAAPPPTPGPMEEPTAESVEEDRPLSIDRMPPELIVGQTAVLEGAAPASSTVTLLLQAGEHELANLETTASPSGGWRIELPVPFMVQGAARLMVAAEAEQQVRPIRLTSGEGDPSGIELSVTQPVAEETAVSGQSLNFAGEVTNAIGSKITLGFLANDCTERIAQQEITLDVASASWNGVILLPQVIQGEHGCATITTGMPNNGNWRQIIIPMQIEN